MLHGTVDGVFRSIIDSGWTERGAGHVSFPVGYFAVVCIPDDAEERAKLRDAVYVSGDKEAEVFDTVPAGWYFAVKNSDGSISHDECKNKDYALARWVLTYAAYEDWFGKEK